MPNSRAFNEIDPSFDITEAKPSIDCPLMDADAWAFVCRLRSQSSNKANDGDGALLVSAQTEKTQTGEQAQERQRLVDRAVQSVFNLGNESERTRNWYIILDGMRRSYESAGPDATVAQAEAAFRSFIDEVNRRLGDRGSITTPPFPEGVEDLIRRTQQPTPDSVINIEIRQGGVLRIGSQSASFRRPRNNQ